MAHNPSSIINFEGFRAARAEWKRCGRGLFLVIVIPCFLLLLLCAWIARQAGETLPASVAAQRQTENPDLLWYSYRSSLYARFKLARVAIDRPDILILGESRSQEFRSAMFRPYTAYNLSSVCYTMASYAELLRHLPPGYNPKVIIFTCDFFLFNPVCTAENIKEGHLQNFNPSWTDHVNAVRDTLVELPHHPDLLLTGIYNPHPYPTLGLGARIGTMGFRQDGSTKWYAQSEDDPNMMRVVSWWDYVGEGDVMGRDETARFEEFVSEAHARGITLIGVQLPMYAPLVQQMEQGQKNHRFLELEDFRRHLAMGYFDRLGVHVFDFMTFPGYSDNYHYFLDPIHPKEGLTLAVLNAMSQDPRFQVVLPQLDTVALKQKLEQDRSDPKHLDLYPHQF